MEFLSQLHPRIVHLPIASFILYFFLESSGIILRKDYLLKAALLILIIGVITSVFAVLTGNQAQAVAKLLLKKDSEINELIELHEEDATMTLFYFSALLFLRLYFVLKKKIVGNLQYIFIVLGLIGCYLIYTAGMRGGDLVFKHGVGIESFGK